MHTHTRAIVVNSPHECEKGARRSLLARAKRWLLTNLTETLMHAYTYNCISILHIQSGKTSSTCWDVDGWWRRRWEKRRFLHSSARDLFFFLLVLLRFLTWFTPISEALMEKKPSEDHRVTIPISSALLETPRVCEKNCASDFSAFSIDQF